LAVIGGLAFYLSGGVAMSAPDDAYVGAQKGC